VADDVDRVQARLLEARQQLAVQEAQLTLMGADLTTARMRASNYGMDVALALMAGFLLGIVAVVAVLWLALS
jgi:hypothetical protein